MKNRISVFIVPPFSILSADGGAENICRFICLALSKKYEVIVLHSEIDKNKPIGILKQLSDNLYSCSAFYLDECTRECGEVYPIFCRVAENAIYKSRLLISFERCVQGIKIPQIVVLGGISYNHCKDVARSCIWDRLVVPSNFIKNQCAKYRSETDRITVIYNGVDCKCFFRINKKYSHKALIPFRPDRGKGFFESIDFISFVNTIGKWGQYSILVTRLDNGCFSDSHFYDEIDKYSREKNVIIEYVSWSQTHEMNNIYNKSDFILALGYLEEGFGLTTIESILSGRAVITRKIGATSEVLPSNFGVIYLDSSLSYEIVTKIMETVFASDMERKLLAGANYIREKYDIHRMEKEFVTLVEEYID